MVGRLLAPWVVISAAAMLPAHAHAQALPGWKIAEICAKESTPGQCAASEGRALKAVSASWTFVLAPIKQACLGQVSSPEDQSWRLLAECIDVETAKAVDKEAVRTAHTPGEPLSAPEALNSPAPGAQIPPSPDPTASKP